MPSFDEGLFDNWIGAHENGRCPARMQARSYSVAIRELFGGFCGGTCKSPASDPWKRAADYFNGNIRMETNFRFRSGNRKDRFRGPTLTGNDAGRHDAVVRRRRVEGATGRGRIHHMS